MNSFLPLHETLVHPRFSTDPARRVRSDTRHVLLVDDDATTRRLTALVLVRAGYVVDTAADGEAGWDALSSVHFDLLVTDHDMPRLTGLELIERLRRAGLKLPVILATGSIDLGEARNHPWLAVSAVLHKPFERADLVSAVHRAVHSLKPQINPAPPSVFAAHADASKATPAETVQADSTATSKAL